MITDNGVNEELKKSLIKSQACFAPLSPEEFEMLAALWKEKHVRAGETIAVEGDPVDSVYIIVSGIADVRHVTVNPNQTLHIESLTHLGPKEPIGLNETGFYSVSGIRTATVVALTDMVLLRLSVAEFHGFALANHHVNEVMHRQSDKLLDTKF